MFDPEGTVRLALTVVAFHDQLTSQDVPIVAKRLVTATTRVARATWGVVDTGDDDLVAAPGAPAMPARADGTGIDDTRRRLPRRRSTGSRRSRATPEALEVAARAAGPDAAVPACPGWTVTDVLEHTGSVLYRASLIIGERRERRPHRSETTAPPGDPFGWYEKGRAAIVPVLRAADPSAEYWTFRGPNPLRWWLRRLANETAVHRVDAEQAAGGTPRSTPRSPPTASTRSSRRTCR